MTYVETFDINLDKAKSGLLIGRNKVMMKYILKRILWVWVLVGLTSSNSYSQVTLDRLILKVGNMNFTQRQFELYIALSSILGNKDSKAYQIVEKNKWLDLLELYLNHMIIDQKARNLESFKPSKNEIIEAKSKINQVKTDNLFLSQFMSRLNYSDSAIEVEMTRALRITRYLCYMFNLENKKAKEKCVAGINTPPLDNSFEWFKRLKKDISFRVYDSAREYKEIVRLK